MFFVGTVGAVFWAFFTGEGYRKDKEKAEKHDNIPKVFKVHIECIIKDTRPQWQQEDVIVLQQNPNVSVVHTKLSLRESQGGKMIEQQKRLEQKKDFRRFLPFIKQ